MAEARDPKAVRFFVAVLAGQNVDLQEVVKKLANEWGQPIIESEPFPFDHTEYYKDEMGEGVTRSFYAFGTGDDPGQLADWKTMTNRMEIELAANSEFPRPVNLDPGYVALEKVVLASAKNFSHRIYLRDGIYGEVTLIYRHGKLNSLPWTFPDFIDGRYDGFLLSLRKLLTEELGIG